jgi:hypothetical protein
VLRDRSSLRGDPEFIVQISVSELPLALIGGSTRVSQIGVVVEGKCSRHPPSPGFPQGGAQKSIFFRIGDHLDTTRETATNTMNLDKMVY